MAVGDHCSNDCKTHGLEQEESREPLWKKQIVEQTVVLAAPPAAASDGNSRGKATRALRVKKLAPEAVLPTRGSAFAAGYDLSSAYQVIVPARGKALVKTELSIAIPDGTYARIAPRSGLAWKHSIDVGAGVIDYDYRGPVAIVLFNHSDTDFNINKGDRVAQLILQKIATPEVVEVDFLESTERGVGGFGSTGSGKQLEVSVTAVSEVVSALEH